MQEWSGRLSFTDVGAIVYYLKAIPWLVPGFSIESHSQHLLTLQRRLESGEGLTFIERKYLIEAYQKDITLSFSRGTQFEDKYHLLRGRAKAPGM
jgi:hypothetical protein